MVTTAMSSARRRRISTIRRPSSWNSDCAANRGSRMLGSRWLRRQRRPRVYSPLGAGSNQTQGRVWLLPSVAARGAGVHAPALAFRWTSIGEAELAEGVQGHPRQHPAVAEAADLGLAIDAVAVAHGQLDDLE